MWCVQAPDRPAHEWRQYEEFAQPNFHKIVHTVQYSSAHSPIEIIWAAVKGPVADLHTTDRTTAALLLHLREGFYGSADGAWKGVTPERCQKAIAHCKSVVTGIIRGRAKLRSCYPDCGGRYARQQLRRGVQRKVRQNRSEP